MLLGTNYHSKLDPLHLGMAREVLVTNHCCKEESLHVAMGRNVLTTAVARELLGTNYCSKDDQPLLLRGMSCRLPYLKER